LSSQDYEFLTRQMATAIELDEKKRGLEFTIGMKRNDIAQLRSNFNTKFSQDVPPKPSEWLDDWRYDVNSERAKLRRLENTREMIAESVSSKARLFQVALVLVAVVITVVVIYWAMQPVPWECGSGEEIITKQLLDGTRDCADGSDEFTDSSFFGVTDAESYEDRQGSNLGMSSCGLLFGWMFLASYFSDVAENVDSASKKNDYDLIDAEIRDIQHKINTEEIGVIYSEWEKHKSREHAQLEMDLNAINHSITSVEKEIEITVHAIKNAFHSVSHFTPYNDRVVFGEQKILGNDMSNPDSVDTSLLDDLL